MPFGDGRDPYPDATVIDAEPGGWTPDRAALYAAQDECLIAIEDKQPIPVDKLKQLPLWRAVLIARVAALAGIELERGTVGQLVAEAMAVGGSAELGDWWLRDSEAEDRV